MFLAYRKGICFKVLDIVAAAIYYNFWLENSQ